MNSLILLTLSGCLSPAFQREIDAQKVYEPYPAAYTPSQALAAYAMDNGEKFSSPGGQRGYIHHGPNNIVIRYEIAGLPNYYLDDALQFTDNTLPFWCIDNRLDGIDSFTFKEGKSEVVNKKSTKTAWMQCISILITTQVYINTTSI